MDSYKKILEDTESLLRYQQTIGIEKYPMDENLRAFLKATLHEPSRMTAGVHRPTAAKKAESIAPKPAKLETLKAIRLELGDCTRCALHQNRTAIVFGAGDENAKLFIVSEWPSRLDDQTGGLLSGPEGEMFDNMLRNVLQTSRDEVYLSSIIKCRGPQESPPSNLEINACQPFIRSQIASVNPKVICAMGPLASQTLLRTDKPLIRLRGRVHDYNGIPLIPTFHPGYLLKNPEMKKATFIDLQLIKKELTAAGY